MDVFYFVCLFKGFFYVGFSCCFVFMFIIFIVTVVIIIIIHNKHFKTLKKTPLIAYYNQTYQWIIYLLT